ncbi:MAG: erythromycin esterase family protein, partial [Chitinivibrionales bacterium]|nr:erythromycin esterase family protein [Chitinivibrionales bacterium]
GLDLYSMYRSIEAVIGYLETVDPAAAEQARKRYECFEQLGKQEQAYGLSALTREDCRAAAVAQLESLRREGEQYVRRNGYVAEEELFYAEQNAQLAANAEVYYRAMFSGVVSTWNLRDRHMADTLDNLMRYLGTHFAAPKIVVWEHNSHIGDARATEVSRYGEFNLGQLVRERYGERAVNIGFSTYDGTVVAAQRWGGEAQRQTLRESLENSYGELFHGAPSTDFYLPLRGNPGLAELARPQRLERAVGVIYAPATERTSHYFFADISRQFDGVIHIDRTRALEPLERGPQWIEEPAPATYARGL